MTSIISRYLSAQFVLPFLLSTLFFVLFLLTFQMFKVMSLVIAKDVQFWSVVELTGHIAVTFLPLALPLSSLFATLYCLGKMSEDSEIVAMRSFGHSKASLMRPFVICGLAVGILCYGLNAEVIPHSKSEFKRILTFLTSKGFFSNFKSGHFFTQIPDVTLFSEKVENDGEKLTHVFIFTESEGQDGEREDQVIFSKKGDVIKDADLERGSSSLRLFLQEGSILKKQTSDDLLEKILYQQYDFPISASDLSQGLVTKDSMLSNRRLWELIKTHQEKPQEFDEETKARTKIEFWSRLNTPLICLVFIILGFGMGIKNARGTRRNTGTLCFIILVAYYALFFLGLSFAKKGHYPAELAIFVPTALASLMAAFYYRKLQ